MAFEVGARTQLVRIAEVTWGTTPATPAMTKARFTDIGLNPVMAFIESKEIRGDRMTSDVRGTTLNGEGDVSFEFTPGDFDDILEAAMGGTWTVNVLKAGLAQKSFTFEEGHLGISQYKLLKGCLIDKFSLSIKPGAIVTGKYSIVSKDYAVAAVTAATTTPAAGVISPYDSQNASSVMKEGGVVTAIITALDFTVDNNTEKAVVVGSKNLQGLQFVRSKVTGTITALFQDAVLMAKFLAETPSSIECTISNGTKSHAFKFGNVKYTGAKSDVTTEGLLAISMPFTALFDAVTATNLQITRVP